MTDQVKAFFKLVAAVALLALAAGFVFTSIRSLRQSGESRASVWFYDESERQLYVAPGGTLSPDHGIGGAPGDGVRAVVVVFRAEQKDRAKQRIAYLEKYSPALKSLLDQVRDARDARGPFPNSVPARDSDFFQTNTLVRHEMEFVWHPVNSVEGAKITSEWRKWLGPEGKPPVVCVP